jgi:hypothetical protein
MREMAEVGMIAALVVAVVALCAAFTGGSPDAFMPLAMN